VFNIYLIRNFLKGVPKAWMRPPLVGANSFQYTSWTKPGEKEEGQARSVIVELQQHTGEEPYLQDSLWHCRIISSSQVDRSSLFLPGRKDQYTRWLSA
jgi:hypothetical protein